MIKKKEKKFGIGLCQEVFLHTKYIQKSINLIFEKEKKELYSILIVHIFDDHSEQEVDKTSKFRTKYNRVCLVGYEWN